MLEIETLDRTCIACPSQWEGKLTDGRMIYVRYRAGIFTVHKSLGPTNDIMDAVDGLELLFLDFNSDFDGLMADYDMYLILEEEGLLKLPFYKKIYFKTMLISGLSGRLYMNKASRWARKILSCEDGKTASKLIDDKKNKKKASELNEN